MIRLAEKFKGRGSQKGWEFNLVERLGNVAIYKKSSESIVVYEVIIIGFRKATSVVMGGVMVHFQESEVYPGDEKFGTSAWAYGNLDAAYIKFHEMIQKARVSSESNQFS